MPEQQHAVDRITELDSHLLEGEGVDGEGIDGEGAADGAPRAELPHPSGWRGVHPLSWVAAGVMVLGVLFTLIGTDYLIGNLSIVHWVVLAATVALGVRPAPMHRVRTVLEWFSDLGGAIAWRLGWVVFVVSLFNVITRYGNDYVDQDILIGQSTSLAWQAFAALFLLGVGYGVKAGVNPRIDFWWADFANKVKAWLDFVLHTFLMLPFLFMGSRILWGFAGTSLGQKFDGTWPEGWQVWKTWEEAPDADNLPLGPIKAMLFVAFVLWGMQILAEVIKAGFVMIGRDDLGDMTEADAPLRVE